MDAHHCIRSGCFVDLPKENMRSATLPLSRHVPLTLGLLGYAVLLGYLQHIGYVIFSIKLLAGAGIVGLDLRQNQVGEKSNRWGVIFVLLAVATWFSPTLSIRFLLICSGIFWLLESQVRKLSLAALIMLLTCSPIFSYAAEVFTFPIRIKLAELAAKMLSLASVNISTIGNQIQFGTQQFAVDTACIGLMMLDWSFLFAAFLLVFYRQRGTIHNFNFVILILLTFGLNVAANLLRICTLILLEIYPENPLHETLGLIFTLFYVWLPLWFLVKKMTISSNTKTTEPSDLKKSKFSTFTLISSLIISSLFLVNYKNTVNKNAETQALVRQIRTENALVYRKPIPHFYSAEHNPSICWRGSGFQLKNISLRRLNGQSIYQAELVKNKEKLYTAWWFSDGSTSTISQTEWRLKALTQGSSFELVNVTVDSPELLPKEVANYLN